MILSLKQQLGIHLLLAFLFCFECRDCSGGAPTRDPEISELSARQRVKRGQEIGKAGTLKMHEKYIFPRLGSPDPRSPRAQAFWINKPNFFIPHDVVLVLSCRRSLLGCWIPSSLCQERRWPHHLQQKSSCKVCSKRNRSHLD
ncbi:hypothetical protein BGZ57DRAFT_913606 [Hyaloscypha finlandica]|nr:hypothetical protein BGZ57DRAFT_913606 [Hyaloscypha finlandica]